MKVVLTNPYCWPHVRRGSESAMHGLGSWLRANHHDVSVMAGHSAASTYEIDGLPYRTIAAPDWRRVHRELDPAVTMIPGMARALRRMQPDLVHAFSYHDAMAAHLARVPYLISYAGIIVPASWRRVPRQYRLFRFATRHASLVFTPTLACHDALFRDYGFDSELCLYGLDTKAFAPKVATVPGRIMSAATPNDDRKRPEFLVRAFAHVAARRPDAHLVFCAAANERVTSRLRALLSEEARDRLIFLGDIDRASLIDEYARASVTALTSLHEAFGLVQVESLAAGTPVVATRSGAVPEVINESIGGMFDPEDEEGCARQLLRFLDDDSPDLTQRCLAHASGFDWDTVGPRIVDLYNKVRRDVR